MDPRAHPAVRRLLARAERDHEVLAVILFGSYARGDARPDSDIDVCLVLAPDATTRRAVARKRLEYLSESDLDLAIFQQLPSTSAAGSSRRAWCCSRATRTRSTRWPATPRGRSSTSATSSVSTSKTSRVVDRDRVLAKLDRLDGYLSELRSIVPARFEEYLRVERKRACERLAQVAVEAVLDVCALLVPGLRLGLPGEEDAHYLPRRNSWTARSMPASVIPSF